ncbi:MAG: hypothetical protein M0Z84_10180, partial [Gammaproteobacteria bacterium]|nr:hypothetical protein [Gammaproteobacteria bacterium]
MNKNNADLYQISSAYDGLESPGCGARPDYFRERAFSGRPASRADRQILRWLLKAAGNPPVRFLLWNGEEVGDDAVTPVARIFLADRAALLRLAINPDL